MRRPLSRSWLFFSLFLLSAFNILPLHAKPAAAPPIAVSVEKAFDYSANGARVPLRVKLENTTGLDKKPLFNSMKGGTETGEPAILIRSSFRPGKAFMQSFTLSSPTISSTK